MKYSCHVYNNFIWFWYDLNGTNLDRRCFQQNYRGVVFLCRNKSSPNAMKLFDDFFGTKEALEASWEGHKSHKGPTRHQGMLGGLAHPGGLWSPRGPSSRETDAKKSYK